MRRILILIAVAASCGPAAAQLTLPGATAPAPLGAVVAPDAGARKARPKGSHGATGTTSAPDEFKLAGKSLHLNGGKSEMAFAARDKTAVLGRLMLAGHKLSARQDECQVDVAGMPLALTPLPRPEGLARFSLPIPACPLTFDVLTGAVLVKSVGGKCVFKEADCETPTDGLWGEQPGALGPDQVKTIERERTQADNNVRAAYKSLVAATKDRAAIRGFAGDQAGFSSHREEVCRDYIGESRHGFCAARLTQARAVTLQAQLVVAQAAKDARKKAKGDKHAK